MPTTLQNILGPDGAIARRLGEKYEYRPQQLEMAEAVSGGPHYRILFMLGALLFAATFVSNMIGEVVINRLKLKLEGRR